MLDFIETRPPAPPEILRIATKPGPEGRTLREIAITGPMDIGLPGCNAILRVEENRIPVVVIPELKTKSKDFTNPAIVFSWVDSQREKSGDCFRFGADGDLGGFPLGLFGPPLYYFHFDDKTDYEALIGSDLPYLPLVQIHFPDLASTYRFNATAGSRTKVQGTHYAVRIAKVDYGDRSVSLKSSVEIVVEGPRGEEDFRLNEDEPVAYGRQYSGLRATFIHPALSGEFRDFVRIITAPDSPDSISFFTGNRRRESGVLKIGHKYTFDNCALTIRSIIPDAQVVEKLVAQDSPATALSCKLIRPGEEDRSLTLFSGSQQSLELIREGLSLSVRPALDNFVKYAHGRNISWNGRDNSQDKFDRKGLLSACYSVSVIDHDRTQNAFVVLSIAFYPIWPFPIPFLLLLGVMLASPFSASGTNNKENLK